MTFEQLCRHLCGLQRAGNRLWRAGGDQGSETGLARASRPYPRILGRVSSVYHHGKHLAVVAAATVHQPQEWRWVVGGQQWPGKKKQMIAGWIWTQVTTVAWLHSWVDSILGLLCSHGYSVPQCPSCGDNMSPIWTMFIIRVPCPSYEYCVSMEAEPLFCLLQTSSVNVMLTGFCSTLETAVSTCPPRARQASTEPLAWGESILAWFSLIQPFPFRREHAVCSALRIQRFSSQYCDSNQLALGSFCSAFWGQSPAEELRKKRSL